MLIDLWIGNQEINLRDYQKIYHKITAQNAAGAKYIKTLANDLGKGVLPIPPEQMQTLLNLLLSDQSTSIELSNHILHDLLSHLPKVRNELYNVLQKNYNCPYLML